jgi:hypothetical protein
LQHLIRSVANLCIMYEKISEIRLTCFAKPRLTEDMYIVQKEEFSITCCNCDMYS